MQVNLNINMLDPTIAKAVLSTFRVEDRLSILDAVSMGSWSQQELEVWGLFCAYLSWGNLEIKRERLLNFYENISRSFLDFIQNPSIQPLTIIYPNAGVKQLFGICLAIRDIFEEFSSIGKFAQSQQNVFCCIFGLANILRKNLEQHYPCEKFNLPKVPLKPPMTVVEKEKVNALKRYCMYLRWMVRDEKPDFGIWKFFDKKDLFHPLDTHVTRILRRWEVLNDEKANWLNVEKVTEYFKKVEPKDPLKYDYHIVTFGRKFCRKNKPLCEKCPIQKDYKFKCSV